MTKKVIHTFYKIGLIIAFMMFSMSYASADSDFDAITAEDIIGNELYLEISDPPYKESFLKLWEEDKERFVPSIKEFPILFIDKDSIKYVKNEKNKPSLGCRAILFGRRSIVVYDYIFQYNLDESPLIRKELKYAYEYDGDGEFLRGCIVRTEPKLIDIKDLEYSVANYAYVTIFGKAYNDEITKYLEEISEVMKGFEQSKSNRRR